MRAAAGSRIGAYLHLAWFAGSRHRQLRRPLLRDQLQRQIYGAGVTALPVIGILALLTGAAVTTQLSALTGADSDLTQRMIFLGLFFELAPLLSALVVVARSSAGIASELAVMNLHDEFVTLRRLGVPAADFLLLPRIFGLIIALPAVTICFQAFAVGSGWLATALFEGRPLAETAARFLDFADPGLALLSLAKSALTGAAVGIIACHHGSSGKGSTQAISGAAIQAVGTGLIAVFMVDVAFAVLLYALG
ncbi:MAG: ABC transporter permease [Betaproteobacteria bacterium]|nr:ABC transporter permease [Rhodocyclales bacterium]